MIGQPRRLATATAITASEIMRLDKATMVRALHDEPKFSELCQEMLAEMVGTTRSRVSFFMNKFRKLGFIDYYNGDIEVHSSLLNVVLQETPGITDGSDDSGSAGEQF